MDRVEVAFRYDEAGRPLPTAFTWQGRIQNIREVGRQWQEGERLHFLCMAEGSQVYELVFARDEGLWYLGHRPPQAASA